MKLRFLIVPYALAMAAAATMIHPCPCCGPTVKYMRAAAAAVWVGIGIWTFLCRNRSLEMFLAAHVMSLVQVVNHWQQFERYTDFSTASTWVVPVAGAGAELFALLAIHAALHRHRPSTSQRAIMGDPPRGEADPGA